MKFHNTVALENLSDNWHHIFSCGHLSMSSTLDGIVYPAPVQGASQAF